MKKSKFKEKFEECAGHLNTFGKIVLFPIWGFWFLLDIMFLKKINNVAYKSNQASAILEFIDLLKENGINLPIFMTKI